MQILRQSTAVDVLIGPFVDSTDGDTEETGLTISAADVKLSKNGQTLTGKSDVTACAHDANGMYNCELDATDTNTVGTLVLFVHETGALAVRHEFQVLEETVYDAMFASGAAGFLQPTTAGRTLDVSALGNAGIDWGNVENPTTSVDLSATSINLCDTITTYTGNTVQTGDAFARLGAPAGASVSADIADVPTVAEFNARTLASADYFDASADTVTLSSTQNAITWGAQTISVTDATANITLAGSGTGDALTFTRSGTGGLFDTSWAAAVESEVNDALTAYSTVATTDLPTNFADLAITATTGQVTVGTNNDKTGYSISGAITTLDGLENISAAEVNTQCDTAIADAALATAAALATVDSNVDSIKQVTDLGVRGQAVSGTLSTTEMTTDLTEATDDHYIGRLVTFTSGVLAGQQSDVTDYDGTTKKLTYTTLTDAPSAGDDFILS